MTKQQQVINWIIEQGEGYTVDTHEVHEIVLSLGVSPSTIYRALKFMREEKSVEGNTFVGRWVRDVPALREAIFGGEKYRLLTAEVVAGIAKRLHSTPAKVLRVIEFYRITTEATFYGKMAVA